MFSTLKAKNHKGIVPDHDVILTGLGKINVLCGENNSGKTSVFEALSRGGKFAIGKHIGDGQYLLSLFKQQLTDLDGQAGESILLTWFEYTLNTWIDEKQTFFSNEIQEYRSRLAKNQQRFQATRTSYNGRSSINRAEITFNNFLLKISNAYTPLLIPPKREINTSANIELKKAFEPNGEGILNRLFYLRNHALKSPDY